MVYYLKFIDQCKSYNTDSLKNLNKENLNLNNDFDSICSNYGEG
jgi:hypothetical protein